MDGDFQIDTKIYVTLACTLGRNHEKPVNVSNQTSFFSYLRYWYNILKPLLLNKTSLKFLRSLFFFLQKFYFYFEPNREVLGRHWNSTETSKLEKMFFYKKLHFSHIDGSQIKISAFPKHGVNRTVVDNHLINITGKFEPCSNSIFREIGK